MELAPGGKYINGAIMQFISALVFTEVTSKGDMQIKQKIKIEFRIF